MEERLVEVAFAPGARVSRYDSEWISMNLPAPGDWSWAKSYFEGKAYGNSPVWELAIDGRAFIYGTRVRSEAYGVVKRTWPRSLPLLELARLGVELDSDLGLITALPLLQPDGRVRVDYGVDMVDAENPDFVGRLKEFDGPKNSADLLPISDEDWFAVPDLTDSGFYISSDVAARVVGDGR